MTEFCWPDALPDATFIYQGLGPTMQDPSIEHGAQALVELHRKYIEIKKLDPPTTNSFDTSILYSSIN